MRESLGFFLRGLLMGFADVVPGVSGGTIAFITGIYDRLISSLKLLNDFLMTAWNAAFDEAKLSDAWNKIDLWLFVPLGLGIMIAFGIGSVVIPPLLEQYPAAVHSFFIGLILASAWFVYRQIKKHDFIGWGLFLLGLLAGAGISLTPLATETETSVGVVLLLGMIAICAMLLPGISGSYMLLMFGKYEYMLESIHEFRIMVLASFIVGMILGLLLFARILNHLLKSYHNWTFFALTGLMLGALGRPGIEVSLHLQDMHWAIPALLFVIGFGIVIVVEKTMASRTRG